MTTRSSTIVLSRLAGVTLAPPCQSFLDSCLPTCGGSLAWRARKIAEARELLALAQVSGRFQVLGLDLTDALRAMLLMQVPVARRPDRQGNLRLASCAHLGLTYSQDAWRLPHPGFSFIQVLAPTDLWYANCAKDSQLLCLGASLPAGIRVRELILMTWGALTLTSSQLDAADPAGIMFPEPAEWWLRNRQRMPLTREPFVRTGQQPAPVPAGDAGRAI
jgi:hypothetical protein